MSDDPAVTSFGAAFVGRTEENSLGSISLEISWVFLWPDPSIIALENLFNAYLKQLSESYETESILHITHILKKRESKPLTNKIFVALTLYELKSQAM